jgi:hypothetical protein
MPTVADLHHQAMECVDLASAARRQGLAGTAAELSIRAADLEMQAARAVPKGPDSEPTYGILHRSAAWCAIGVGRYEEAMQLAEEGLANDPPAWLKAELTEVGHAAQQHQNAERRGELPPSLAIDAAANMC